MRRDTTTRQEYTERQKKIFDANTNQNKDETQQEHMQAKETDGRDENDIRGPCPPCCPKGGRERLRGIPDVTGFRQKIVAAALIFHGPERGTNHPQ